MLLVLLPRRENVNPPSPRLQPFITFAPSRIFLSFPLFSIFILIYIISFSGLAPRSSQLSSHSLEASASSTSSTQTPSDSLEKSKNQLHSDDDTSTNKIINEIGRNLGIDPGDYQSWYRVRLADILSLRGGRELLAQHRFSLPKLLRFMFPDHNWNETEFSLQNDSLTGNKDNIRAFLVSLGNSLSIDKDSLQKWHKVPPHIFASNGGAEILQEYGFNLPKLFRAAFPEHRWRNTGFLRDPSGVLSREIPNPQQRREAILKIGEKLGIDPSSYEGWYKVTLETYKKLGAENLFRTHKKAVVPSISRYRLFSTLFPEHKWHPMLFVSRNSTPSHLPNEEIERFRRFLEEKLSIKRPEDWYAVIKADLAALDLPNLFQRQSDLVQFLTRAYQKQDWYPEKMAWSSFGWSNFHSLVTQLFPSEKALRGIDFFPPESSANPNLQRLKSLIIPKFQIVFLYQGPLSFLEQFVEGKVELVNVAPNRKDFLEHCKKQNLDLLLIPFWWDKERKSLLATLWKQRADLFSISGPLVAYKDEAITNQAIPEKVKLKELRMRPSSYLKSWAKDPRFESMFVK